MDYSDYEILRDKAGLTDYKVAKEAGIPRSTFNAWKNGVSKPKTEKLSKILAILYEYGVKIKPETNKVDFLFRTPDGADDFLAEINKVPDPIDRAMESMRFINLYEKLTATQKELIEQIMENMTDDSN